MAYYEPDKVPYGQHAVLSNSHGHEGWGCFGRSGEVGDTLYPDS